MLLAALPHAHGLALPLAVVALTVAGSIAWAVGLPAPGAFAVLSGAALAAAGMMSGLASAPALGLSIAAAPFVPPLLAAALAGLRGPLLLASIAAVVAGPLRTLIYDPFLDPGCSLDCRRSSLAIEQHTTVASALLIAGGCACALFIAVAALRAPHRLGIGCAALAALAVAAGRGTLALAGAALLVTSLLGLDTARLALARSRAVSLGRALAGDADVQAALRAAVGDEALAVSYPLGAGDTFELPPTVPGQMATDIAIGDRPIARIVHSRNRSEVTALAGVLDGPALLAIEAESLAAQVGTQAAELRASRARIVERADAERRRLERDVHDGAQQHVLALGLELRLALDALPPGDPGRARIESCVAETDATLDELRDLSHGIFPAVLETAGLASAIRTTAAQRGRAIALTGDAGRLPAAVERAAHALVAEQITGTCDPLDVALSTDGGALEVRIQGTLTPPRPVVFDRFAAVLGTVRADSRTIVARIPLTTDPIATHA